MMIYRQCTHGILEVISPYGVIVGVNQWNMMLAQVDDQPNAKEMRQKHKAPG